VHRIPEQGSGEIKYVDQLTVRDTQAGVFFYQGKAVGVFGCLETEAGGAGYNIELFKEYWNFFILTMQALFYNLTKRN